MTDGTYDGTFSKETTTNDCLDSTMITSDDGSDST